MTVIPLKLRLEGPEAERMVIAECAKFIRRRIADTQAAEAWIACGESLRALKKNLKKVTARGDNEHIGWQQAFELEPREFPFGRVHADQLIKLYEFFTVHACTVKKLPAAFNALHAIVRSKFNSTLIEQCIMDGSISPGSTTTEIIALAKRLQLKRKAKPDPRSAPKSKRIAKVLAYMKRLGISQEDLPNG